MAYTALYRKFRPICFSQMVGQEHITETLKKQIVAGRVGHAYLFNGGRGTGKTSSAKILARAVNCLNPKDGEPCNECEICKEILAGALTDVVEMDAASNNSVEDIRGIREEVNFLPTKAKYRVYIIDEVHMLSTGAFNALLKTLEEPPEHVKFILATTEPQKLPATILSRCQRFDFKRISTEDVIKRLKIICNESNIQITDEALKIIAILSEGAMRDAISILERCSGVEHEGLIDDNYVRELVGIPKTEQINLIVKNIIEENANNVIEEANKIIDEGKDIDNFLWEIIKYVKDVLVFKSTNNLEIYNEEEKNRIKELSEKTEKERLLKAIYDLSELANDIKWSSQKNIMFQAGLIKASMNIQPQSVINKECKAENVAKVPKVETIQKSVPKPSTMQNVSKSSIVNTGSYWNNVINRIKEIGKMSIYVNLIGSTAKEVNDMTVEVCLANKNEFAKNVLESYENKSEIEKQLSLELNKTMNVKFVTNNTSSKKENTENLEKMIDGLDIPINIIDE